MSPVVVRGIRTEADRPVVRVVPTGVVRVKLGSGLLPRWSVTEGTIVTEVGGLVTSLVGPLGVGHSRGSSPDGPKTGGVVSPVVGPLRVGPGRGTPSGSVGPEARSIVTLSVGTFGVGPGSGASQT